MSKTATLKHQNDKLKTDTQNTTTNDSDNECIEVNKKQLTNVINSHIEGHEELKIKYKEKCIELKKREDVVILFNNNLKMERDEKQKYIKETEKLKNELKRIEAEYKAKKKNVTSPDEIFKSKIKGNIRQSIKEIDDDVDDEYNKIKSSYLDDAKKLYGLK